MAFHLFALACTSAWLGGCADTGRTSVELNLLASGTGSAASLTSGDVTLTLERADLAFGPLYLCAGATAGDLCDTARLEWLGSALVDARAQEVRPLGVLSGVSGPVQSWMYDLGISSQLTRDEPFVLDAAEQLGGASLAFEARAERGGRAVRVKAAVRVQQTDTTELGVPVIRKSPSDPSMARDVGREDRSLLVRFDPMPWLESLDLASLFVEASCTAGGSPTVCEGAVERRCAPDGSIIETRDCGTVGEACVAGVGCAGELVLSPDSEAYRSLRNALVSGARPTFQWNVTP
jgi:hypothetical protein